MSIIIFLVTAVLSGAAIWFFDGGDSVPVFALSVIIGLGAAIWFCLTRNTWKQIAEGVRDGLNGNSDKQQKNRSMQDGDNIAN